MTSARKKKSIERTIRPKYRLVLVDAGRYAKIEDGHTMKSQNQNILYNLSRRIACNAAPSGDWTGYTDQQKENTLCVLGGGWQLRYTAEWKERKNMEAIGYRARKVYSVGSPE